jgi:hypothetical protein
MGTTDLEGKETNYRSYSIHTKDEILNAKYFTALVIEDLTF